MKRVTPEIRGDILIVDDTPQNLKLLSQILEDNDYRVRAARTGTMALISSRSHPPDLILLDIKMPEMNGYEVCKALKADDVTHDIPVIFISALNDIADIVHAFEVGGVDYVTKPFNAREIIVRVDNHLTLARQRQHIEERRIRDTQYLEALNQMKSQFIGASTHDLKNPLAMILAYAGMLEGDHSEETISTVIEGIRDNTQKILTLVTDMLDIMQVESGTGLVLKHASLSALVETSLQNFAVIAKQKHLSVENVRDETDVLINVDTYRFSQVIDNLISNAIKYTPEGGHVKVETLVNAEWAYLRISDSGLGIPEEDLSHIFDSFYRVNQPKHLEVEGSGLGLSISNAIVQQHGGQISVDSTPGKGSTFTVQLPLPETITTSSD